MILVHITSTAKQGGGPSHVLSLLQLLDSRYIDQYALFPPNERFSRTLAKYAKQSYDFPNSPLMFILLLLKIRSLVKANTEVVFHSHGPAAGLLGKIFRLFFTCKHIYTPHGVQFTSYGFLKKNLYILYEFFSAFLIDMVIYISHSEKSILESHIGSLYHIPSVVIENTVNPNKIIFFKPEDIPINSSTQSSSTRQTVAMIGRICKQKNSILIFDICLLMPHVNFVYVGDAGDQYPEFISRLNSLNLANLKYLPNIENLKNFYSKIDLLFAPSVHEGLPYVVLESLCNYIPVVLSKIPAFLDLCEKFDSPLLNYPKNTHGLLTTADDYANCINSVLSSSRYAMATHSCSIELVEHYSRAERWSISYLDCYSSVT